MRTEFSNKQPVWVKFDGLFWPGQVWPEDDPSLKDEVVKERKNVPKADTLIRFFSSKDFTWLHKQPGNNIIDFEEGLPHYSSQQIPKRDMPLFKRALQIAKDWTSKHSQHAHHHHQHHQHHFQQKKIQQIIQQQQQQPALHHQLLQLCPFQFVIVIMPIRLIL